MNSLKSVVRRTVKSITKYVNVSVTVNRNAKKFIIPVVNNIGLPNFVSEKDWFEKLIVLLKLPEHASIIDVGANVGQSLLAIRSRYNNPYFGFEPNPDCVFYIKKLIKVNKFSNTSIIPVGLSSSSQVISFYSRNDAEQSATTMKDLRPGFYSEDDISYVPVFSFDDLKTLPIHNIGFIKIDVEGAELEVLKGFQKAIKQYSPVITCEVLDCHSPEKSSLEIHQNRTNELVQLVKDLGYQIYRINLKGKLSFDKMESIILQHYTAESEFLNDYLFLPANKKIEDLV